MDETLFKTKTMNKREYCRQGENIELSQQTLSHPAKALLMAISFEGGVEPWQIFDKSVNMEKFH